ncbi:MAG: 6-chlorohydroxyquinol-1,2-dioxygenase [Candidatus Dormibacteraeota bacterium]|nr:6-chlorohydroxyquinol-1,2-dioxygenase [Candidatus Dormibacteraeota bacterium]
MTSVDRTVPVLTGDTANTERLRTCVARAINALHGVVRELELTESELHSLVGFLNRVGVADEFMLLSDVTHTSILVDGLTAASGAGSTAGNVSGPMYRAGARMDDTPAVIARIDQGDQPLTLRGRVSDATTGLPLPGALLDIWQTNGAGLYDDQDPEQPPGNLRGVVRCDHSGRYEVRTVLPGPYRIASMNGPVYALLNTLGRHDNRPAHIHLRVSAKGHRPLTTMLFIAGDPWLDDDVIGAMKPELVVAPGRDGAGVLAATFDVGLSADAPS